MKNQGIGLKYIHTVMQLYKNITGCVEACERYREGHSLLFTKELQHAFERNVNYVVETLCNRLWVTTFFTFWWRSDSCNVTPNVYKLHKVKLITYESQNRHLKN